MKMETDRAEHGYNSEAEARFIAEAQGAVHLLGEQMRQGLIVDQGIPTSVETILKQYPILSMAQLTDLLAMLRSSHDPQRFPTQQTIETRLRMGS